MSKNITFKDLEKEISKYLPASSLGLIEKANQFADTAHKDQYRKSGDLYITHPLEVAFILAKLKQDADCIIAALLHDTMEDCGVSFDQIKDKFGENVAILVDGVTKLGKIQFCSKEEEQAENFRKMFLAMAKDIRVIIIKLADRLHNMRTLKYLSSEQQNQISQETRELFSPIAHRLGMWSLKWELEDLAFYYLSPHEFKNIKSLVAATRSDREAYVDNFIGLIRDLLKKLDLKAEVYGRPKHFFSIFHKLQKQKIPFEELYDTLALRILTETVRDCYEILGMIHSAFKPISGRIKDYIAVPKSNGYQSLHTTVIGPEGKPLEIQIRTYEMHKTAELGIAAHWQYKEARKKSETGVDFAWLRQIIDLQKEQLAPKDFLRDLKTDLFIDEVFIFSPKGDLQVLSKGSTPVDFAYKVHTAVGHRCIGAKVNNHIVPLNYKLKSGDRVEIMTSKKENPNVGWLQFVKTHQAKNKIKQWIRKQQASDHIAKGKDLLEKNLLMLGLIPKEVLTSKILKEISGKYRVKTYDEVYLLIGLGELSYKEIINFVNKFSTKEKVDVKPEEIKKQLKTLKTEKKNYSNIKVLGEPNVMVRIANCCHPLPGDNIIGFVTLGSGVSIHRADCNSVLNIKDQDKMRLIDVEWDVSQKSEQPFLAWLEVEAFSRNGLLQDVVNRVADIKTDIKDIQSKTNEEGAFMRIRLALNIRSLSHLEQVKKALGQISDIVVVRRIVGGF